MSILNLFREANSKLNGKHLLAIGTVLIYCLITGIPSGFDERYGILSLLISAPLTLGISSFFLNLVRGNEVRVEQIFDGFKNYVPSLIMTILITLAVGFGLVLFIIPGIIIAIGFSMSYFILADNPKMDAVSALKASWEMMKGRLLCVFFVVHTSLYLRLIGLFCWYFLCFANYLCSIGFVLCKYCKILIGLGF